MSTYINRLKALAKHLRRGKLGHKTFNFDYVNAIEDPTCPPGYKPAENTCGTVGCAMGELPIAFPDHWGFGSMAWPFLFRSTTREPGLDIRKFFRICEAARKHLFYPECQDPRRFGGKHLDKRATRTQVAANIEAYVSILEAKKEAQL